MAFNNPTIDYFSLDVEGSELAILKTIPFDKVDIRVSQQLYTAMGQFHHYDAYVLKGFKAFLEGQCLAPKCNNQCNCAKVQL